MRAEEIEVLGDFLPRDGTLVADRISEVARIGESIVLVHGELWCQPPCPIHAPSNHHMRYWPAVWFNVAKMIQRECVHRNVHPDPDDIRGIVATLAHHCCKEECCDAGTE